MASKLSKLYLDSLCLLHLVVVVIIITTCIHSTSGQVQDPVVVISSGLVRGIGNRVTRDGGLYLGFFGIPYGTFERRFQASRAVDPWGNDIFNATQPGPNCYQSRFSDEQIMGEQDCLNLNVFTPRLPNNDTSLRPVMVYVHGGAFFVGAGSNEGPDYLMDEDIVLVTLNYRLGAFGSLNMGIPGAAGNQGAKDVLLALQWVQDNIAAFNGDPGLVTLFGESAGSMLTSAIYHSPLGVGLFHRAIAQSGPSTSKIVLNGRPSYYGERVAIKVGCLFEGEDRNASQIVLCLQNTAPEAIHNALNPTDDDWYNEEDNAEHQYNLSVDGGVEGEEAFMPLPPAQLLLGGGYNRSVPLMMGVNAYEGIQWSRPIIANPQYINSMNTEWNRVAPIPFAYYHALNRNNISSALKTFYFGSDAVFQNNLEFGNVLEAALADRMFVHPARRYAQLLASTSATVYLYMFDKKMSKKAVYDSPVHAEELNYLFLRSVFGVNPPIDSNSPDYAFSKHMIKLWVSFAMNGVPSYVWGNNSEVWSPVDPAAQEVKWYHIDDDTLQSVSESSLFRERMEFWESVD